MKVITSRLISALAMVAGLGLASSAHAEWTFPTSTYSGISATGTVAPADPKVSLTGFNVTNNASNVVNGNWNSATIASHGSWGLGMYSGGETASPYHALDNNGITEGILLSFDTSIVLKSIGLGYTATPNGSGGFNENGSTQVDLSVFRWVGTGGSTATTAPNLAGVTASTMAGWELVGNYGDMTYDVTNPYNTVNGGNKGSSWWLITAYNSGYSQSAGVENRGSLDNGNDYFKLLAVAGTQCVAGSTTNKNPCGTTSTRVPEPASLALTSVALLGMVGVRRRLKVAKAA